MPRRRALTEAQLQTLFALPATEADLIQHWTLGSDDLAVVGRRRRDHNRLGSVLQLCALRYPGRLLRPGEAIPEPALRFVADQLGTDPEILAACAVRFQTRYEQLDALREAFGFEDLTPARRREMLGWLLPVALATTNAFAIAQALMDELRRRRIITPGPFVVERLVAAESYATGATVHRATGIAVAVALDTSNLMAVATALRDQDPARPIYLAADNDHHLPLRAKPLPNAGHEKAEAAAADIGATVLLPEPVADQAAKGKGADWNDYEASYGTAATRAALRRTGLQELAMQSASMAVRPDVAESQGAGLSA